MKTKNELLLALQAAINKRNFQAAVVIMKQLEAVCVLDDQLLYTGAYVCFQAEHFQEAVNYLQEVLKTQTRLDAEAYALLGRAERKRLHFNQAIKALESANGIVEAEGVKKSDFLMQNYNLLGQWHLQVGNIEKAGQCYFKAMTFAGQVQDRCAAYSSYLMTLHYHSDLSNKEIYGLHEKYQELVQISKKRAFCIPKRDKYRIGYVSPDFRAHVMYKFYYSLLCMYDRKQFEVYAYTLNEEDRYTDMLRMQVTCLRNLKDVSEQEAVDTIRKDALDIAFDLAGHSANSGLPLFAQRLAPVQISGLGYFNTTGLKVMDYILTDIYTDPPEEKRTLFTEKSLRLSKSQFCYTPLKNLPDVQGTPCKKNKFITFCCFNKYAKMTDEVLAVWSEILKHVPKSKLLLKSFIFIDQEIRAAVTQRLEYFGISSERLELRPATNTYMEEFQEADIVLDTFPYPGGGMICDAVFMGIPVITMAGECHGERFGYSILCNAGLQELTAATKAEYIEKAIGLAYDEDLLDLLHRNLRTMVEHSPLMNQKRYMSEIEEQYRAIIKERRGEL